MTLLHLVAGMFGTAYLHLVGKTSVVEALDHPSYLDYRRRRRPLIYAFWHNTQIFLAYAHRGEGIHVIVSQSKDGEYVAQVMRRLGLNAVRGSSSKGGEAALREMIGLLEAGEPVGFTPDGPRGPVQTVQGGVVSAAQASGAPIVAIAVSSRRRMTFSSWDKFFVPLPFSHIVVAHGKPFFLNKEIDLAAAKEEVRQNLNEACALAEAAERGGPSWGFSLLGAVLFGVYNFLILSLAPLWIPALAWKYGVKRAAQQLTQRLGGGIPPVPPGRKLWFHNASIGEWQALKPLLNALESKKGLSFLVTVSTPEAKELILKEAPGLPVALLPMDLPWVVRRWIKKVNPDALLLVESELWPNLMHVLHRAKVPIFIVNGRLSETSFRFWKFFKPLAQKMMSEVSGFFVRTETDGRRFFGLGARLSDLKVTGNLKYDTLRVAPEDERLKLRRATFGGNDGVYLIAGSTWPGEEEEILELLKETLPMRLRIILAPRRSERFDDVERLLESIPQSWSAWSKAKSLREWSTDILLVDTLGDLKDLYGAADVAFVGGSLAARGGQNPLEAACARLPVLFGPSMENFHREAQELKKAGAARQVRDGDVLRLVLKELITDEPLRRSMGEAASKVVREKQGGVRETVAGLSAYLGLP